MGWKSTINITRERAIDLILSRLDRSVYDNMTDSEIEEMLYKLGFGDETNLPYFGYNFNITDNNDLEYKDF